MVDNYPKYRPKKIGEKAITYSVYMVETKSIREKIESSIPPNYETHKKMRHTFIAEEIEPGGRLVWCEHETRNY